MTAQNLERLAREGRLGNRLGFEGCCMAGAIDACFVARDVSEKIYEANAAAVEAGEIGGEGPLTDRLFDMLGELFGSDDPSTFAPTPYIFRTLGELVVDLNELRGEATILLDTEDGRHTVGLKPTGELAEDSWQIVGVDQIVAVLPQDGPMDVQGLIEPEPITAEKVWQYIVEKNPNNQGVFTAQVFPSELAG